MDVSANNDARRLSLLQFIPFHVIRSLSTEAPSVRNFTLPSANQYRLARLHLRDLSRAARIRLAWFDWHRSHGENASLTCRHFGISRSTFYRWKARYNPKDLATLEDRSSRPHHCRQRQWTTAQVLAVKAVREQYPCWGKDKLVVLLRRAGLVLSTSTVGRILGYLKRGGQLREPLRRISGRRRQWKRQYATRKPREYVVKLPGDIVQLDTMDIRPEPGVILKQFTAIDVESRWGVATIVSRATASLATRALDAIQARMPFPVRAIQVDGGSEFMGEFEELCKARGLLLFELPPRSPKLNGRVERANRTFREEFYNVSTAEPTVRGFRRALRAWETTYNTIRPHQSLGQRTPHEYLATYHPEVLS